jgi:Tfp pilus assembly protein PilX
VDDRTPLHLGEVGGYVAAAGAALREEELRIKRRSSASSPSFLTTAGSFKRMSATLQTATSIVAARKRHAEVVKEFTRWGSAR